MDYLKERLPLISEVKYKDIKKFKGKLIDTMYSHYDDLTTIDCIQKIQMEMDQSVLESSLQPITIIGEVAIPTIMFLNFGFVMWMINTRNISSYFLLLGFWILGFILTIYGHKQNHETFKQRIQDLKNICDVLIKIHRQNQ